MNHTFEYVKVDTCHMLMPQRRERVWGSSSSGVVPDSQYAMSMRMTMQRLKSPTRFPLSQILEPNLPACDGPQSDAFQTHLQNVELTCKERNLDPSKATLDTSTGKNRKPEWAHDMLTCVRPSHRVWLVGEHRFASATEVLASHGVFPALFENPQELLGLDPSIALDFAGNAFSTPVLIAKILSTMVNANPWKTLAECGYVRRSGVLKVCSKNAAKRANSGSDQGSSGPADGEKAEEPPEKKSKHARTGRKRKVPDSDPAGGTDKNKQRRGKNEKGSLLTIAKKVEILRRYAELQKTEKHPEKAPSYIFQTLPKNNVYLYVHIYIYIFFLYSMYMALTKQTFLAKFQLGLICC